MILDGLGYERIGWWKRNWWQGEIEGNEMMTSKGDWCDEKNWTDDEMKASQIAVEMKRKRKTDGRWLCEVCVCKWWRIVEYQRLADRSVCFEKAKRRMMSMMSIRINESMKTRTVTRACGLEREKDAKIGKKRGRRRWTKKNEAMVLKDGAKKVSEDAGSVYDVQWTIQLETVTGFNRFFRDSSLKISSKRVDKAKKRCRRRCGLKKKETWQKKW